jgi:hypothetical protein
LKWLLNERAAIAGAIAKGMALQAALQKKRLHQERALAKVVQHIDGNLQMLSEKRATLEAMDATIEMVDSRVNAAAGGTVRAWAERYGARGGLQRHVAQILEKSAPSAVSMAQIIQQSAEHFGTVFLAPPERESFRWSIKSALTRLQRAHMVEQVPGGAVNVSRFWRWKANQLPTIAQIAAMLEASEHDRNSHTP